MLLYPKLNAHHTYLHHQNDQMRYETRTLGYMCACSERTQSHTEKLTYYSHWSKNIFLLFQHDFFVLFNAYYSPNDNTIMCQGFPPQVPDHKRVKYTQATFDLHSHRSIMCYNVGTAINPICVNIH